MADFKRLTVCEWFEPFRLWSQATLIMFMAPTAFSQIRAMVTGWDDVEEDQT